MRFLQDLISWSIAFLIALCAGFCRHLVFFSLYVIDGRSMMPTLHHGDLVLVDTFTYSHIHPPRRGDIIALAVPEDPSFRSVKRVIGVGGDTVRIADGRVYVNGQTLGTEDYVLEPPMNDFAEVQVPSGTVFVLGDNRNNSEDSRFSDVGFVPTSLILGQALCIRWPGFDAASLLLPNDTPMLHIPQKEGNL